MQIKQHLLDKRVIERALKKGLLDSAQYEKAISSLPDASHNVQRTNESAPEPTSSGSDSNTTASL